MKLLTSSVVAVLAAGYAGAAEVDFSRRITDLDGKDIPASADKGANPLDLARVAGLALLAQSPDDARMAQEAKLARFNLAIKVHSGGRVDLTSEEVTLLKGAISAAYPPLVVGRAVEILDPPAKPKDK